MSVLLEKRGPRRAPRPGSAAVRQPLEFSGDFAFTPVDRFGGRRGGVPAEVRFAERAQADARAGQLVETAEEAWLVADPADDKEGMFLAGRKEGSGGFDRGVTGLHHLLGVGQVPADEDVQV